MSKSKLASPFSIAATCWHEPCFAAVMASSLLVLLLSCGSGRDSADSLQKTAPGAGRPEEAEGRQETEGLRSARGFQGAGRQAAGAVGHGSFVLPSLALYTDPSGLQALEAAGYDLGSLLFGVPGTRGDLLALQPGWRSFVDVARGDVATVVDGDPEAGPSLAFPHRTFEPSWLEDPASHFDLVGVVSRLDRIPQHPDTCGELRLVYRLVTEVPFQTPLPFEVLLSFGQRFSEEGISGEGISEEGSLSEMGGLTEESDCASVARAWRIEETAEALLQGPLASKGTLLAVESNFQAVRWPAGARPDLGSHSAYVLRTYGPDLEATPLENTPDVARIAADPLLENALRTWVDENRQGILEGTAILPSALSAEVAVGVAPGGLARQANRPWRQLLDGEDAELLRRLDGQSCQGCHQERSSVGFHLPGTGGQLLEAASPHLQAATGWRQEVLGRVEAGGTVGAVPEVAPADGTYGAPCGLSAAFSAVGCGAGLECLDLLGDEMGICLPPLGVGAGSPYTTGSLVQTADSRLDIRSIEEVAACRVGESVPRPRPGTGHYMGGVCLVPCEVAGEPRDLGGPAVCAPFGVGDFSKCLLKGVSQDRCFAENQGLMWVAACDAETPCRDDFACMRVKEGAPGACVPPYLLPEMRTDTRMGVGTGR